MINLLDIRFTDHRNYIEDIVVHQNGKTYFIKQIKGQWTIKQTMDDVYLGSHPFGIYSGTGVEIWPIDYSKYEPKPQAMDYDEDDYEDDLEGMLNRRMNRSNKR